LKTFAATSPDFNRFLKKRFLEKNKNKMSPEDLGQYQRLKNAHSSSVVYTQEKREETYAGLY